MNPELEAFIKLCNDQDTKQTDAAHGYAHLIRTLGGGSPEFKAANDAMRTRWPRGYTRIKAKAWVILKKDGTHV